MIESFVDLTYRGLALGRRIKLTQVRPSTGYLETAAPMPVGTAIKISTDEGVELDATIAEVHEQVGGSTKSPGMVVRPKLDGDAAASWWSARVALPELVTTEVAPAVGTVRPKRKTEGVPELVDDGHKTAVTEVPELPRDTAVIDVPATPAGGPSESHAIEDDGKRTTAMDAVDLEALGLDAATSNPVMPAAAATSDDDAPDKSGSRKKRKRR